MTHVGGVSQCGERVSTPHHQSDRSECYQVAHNQYTENKINRRRTFSLFAFIAERVSWMSLSPNDRAPITAITSRQMTDRGLNISVPVFITMENLSWTHNGAQWAGLWRGAGEICQLEWTGRSRGCGQKHSVTLSSEPDKKYLQTMIRWWD